MSSFSGVLYIDTIKFQCKSKYQYKFKYEYDKKDNWIKQYQFDEEGELAYIVKRKITYFNDYKKSKNDFTGIWNDVDSDYWFDIKKDKTYDFGNGSSIQESGQWEIDKERHVLTFRAKNIEESTKYKYAFQNSQLVLYSIPGDEEYRLEK